MSAAVACTPPLRFLLKCSIYMYVHHHIYRSHHPRCRFRWRFRFWPQTWDWSSPRLSFWRISAFWAYVVLSHCENAKKLGFVEALLFSYATCKANRRHSRALWGPVGVHERPWRRRGRPSGAGRASTNSFLALLNVLSGTLPIYG